MVWLLFVFSKVFDFPLMVLGCVKCHLLLSSFGEDADVGRRGGDEVMQESCAPDILCQERGIFQNPCGSSQN